MKAIQENKPKNVSKLENLKKNTKSSLKAKHGGHRPKSGRKPNEEKEKVRQMKEIIEGHGLEVEDINGKKLARVSILLTVLFREGAKGNVSAIKEYLDRQVGKSIESIELGNKEGRVFKVKITTVGDKKNGNKLGTNQKTE